MINLKNTSGLDIMYNNDRRKIILSDNVIVTAVAQKLLRQMQSVIINDNLVCPEIFYTIYAHVFRKKDDAFWKQCGLVYDLTFILPNLAGIEFVKTFGHYNDIDEMNPDGMAEIIEVTYGSGIVILQKPQKKEVVEKITSINDLYDFDILSEVHIVKITKGDKLVIPPGYAYIVINTKNQLLAIGTLSALKRRPIIEPLYRFHGGAYYLIRKNARQEIVKNPHYKQIAKIKKSKTTDFNSLLQTKSSQPLYLQAIRNPDKFDFLLRSKEK